MNASLYVPISRDEFEDAYIEVFLLRKRESETVFCGYTTEHSFPVAVKHIDKSTIEYMPMFIDEQLRYIPLELILMKQVSGDSDSVEKHAALSPIGWADLEDEVLLIMEMPETSMDVVEYMNIFNVDEGLAKVLMIQLVDTVNEMQEGSVFHRDLQLDNIVIERDEDWRGPRVRIIDFGRACFIDPAYCNYNEPCHYNPPEFYYQGTYKAGPTTVWQLGIILFQLLTKTTEFIMGKLQLCGGFLTEAIMQLNVSPDCKHFLRSCLHFNPRQRVPLDLLSTHPWFSLNLREL